MFAVCLINVYQRMKKDDRSVFEMYQNEYERIAVDEKDKNVQWNDDYQYDEGRDVLILVDGMDLDNSKRKRSN